MAREIKKPMSIREQDLKEYAGEIVIDVNPKDEETETVEVTPEETSVVKASSVVRDAVAEQVAVTAAQTATTPGVHLISFGAWFQKVSAKNPRIKLSYREAIEAHCKAVGLHAKATEEAFNAALSHFGL